jgi:hypothetical protein
VDEYSNSIKAIDLLLRVKATLKRLCVDNGGDWIKQACVCRDAISRKEGDAGVSVQERDRERDPKHAQTGTTVSPRAQRLSKSVLFLLMSR